MLLMSWKGSSTCSLLISFEGLSAFVEQLTESSSPEYTELVMVSTKLTILIQLCFSCVALGFTPERARFTDMEQPRNGSDPTGGELA